MFTLTAAIVNSTTPKVWSLSPTPAVVNWVPVTFGVAAGRVAQSFSVSQPSSISPVSPASPASRTLMRIEDHTNQGADNHFDYFTLTATVNSSASEPFTLYADGVPITTPNAVWVYNGWAWQGGLPGPPPPPGTPGQYSFSLQVTGPRADNLFALAMTPPTGPSASIDSFTSIDISSATLVCRTLNRYS